MNGELNIGFLFEWDNKFKNQKTNQLKICVWVKGCQWQNCKHLSHQDFCTFDKDLSTGKEDLKGLNTGKEDL